eukprot:364899-Chlamydomonas_euryale.AAC.42
MASKGARGGRSVQQQHQHNQQRHVDALVDAHHQTVAPAYVANFSHVERLALHALMCPFSAKP